MKKKSVDLSGIGQVKAKAVKRPPEAKPGPKAPRQSKPIPAKKEKKSPEKPTKPLKPNKLNKQKDVAFRKNLTEALIPELKNEYNLSSFSVYYACESDFPHRIYGEELEGIITIEKYLSYANPVILINPNGIVDNRAYKSRYITRVYLDNEMYLVCMSSYSIEAFRGSAGEQITKKIYGRLTDEFSAFLRQKTEAGA